ncbi:MAG: enolase C-terminal domain-like protein [Bacilli bacterium]
MKEITIANVKTILTAPEGIALAVVKLETSEPGLYGVGCATFTQRALAVAQALDHYLKPFVLGKSVHRIEDLWASAMVSGYWRNGPVLNAALSGVDMALWDIKGKVAGLPCYELWGGKCREGAAVYRHADGRDPQEVGDQVQNFLEQGYTHVRCQMGGYGGLLQSSTGGPVFRNPHLRRPLGALPGAYFDPEGYARSIPQLFEALRVRFGDDVELLHDVHERLSPSRVVWLARALEPYDLFFLEDPLPPESIAWFERLRAQTGIPLAMGELFTHPLEWTPLIQNRLIDFIRVHLSQIGGITPAKKLAALCEYNGIATAWHGPGDVSPVGHAANLHLDLSAPNFGIQEWSGIGERSRLVFPGSPEVVDGYLYPNEGPGLGIDIDEREAAKYPADHANPAWTLARTPDGTSARP